jgi:transposase
MQSRIEELEALVKKLLQRTELLDGQLAKLNGRVAELETENGRLRAENRRLKRENRKLTDANRWLRQEVRRLGGRTEPPPEQRNAEQDSEDEESAPPGEVSGGGERRRRGGQPNHPPHNRALLPEKAVDRVVPVKPEKCGGCGVALRGKSKVAHRHQVTEIPEPKAETVEWQLHSMECACGTVTVAALPEGVPRGAFGPRLQAFVGLLTGCYRVSKRGAQELLKDAFGVTMSLGSVTESEQAVSAALAAPHAEALAHAQKQPVKHADETGWPEGQEKAYLWTIVTAAVTVFAIAGGRTKALAAELLGARGVLVSDRLASYHFWPDRRRQFCWAHLKRRFEEFLLGDATSYALGARLLSEVRKLFDLWHRARDGTLTRRAFTRGMRPVMRSVRSLLQEGLACADPEVSGTCRELLEHEDALWTFVRVEGVEPTNNAAEQALRHGVIWRKGCYGTQSARGSRFVERILTTRATLRAQERNVMKFVVAACEARLAGEAPPSLLPAQVAHPVEAKSRRRPRARRTTA